MALITKIEATISTGDNATNGTVFLGIAGREFVLNKRGNDFKRNTVDHFVMGVAAADLVENAAKNNPNTPMPLDTDDLDVFPTYIRLEASTAWQVLLVTIAVTSSLGTETIRGLQGTQNLYLGPDYGMYLYLKRS